MGFNCSSGVKGRTGTAGDPQDLNAAQAWEVVGQAGKASAAEVLAGTNDSQFVTPAGLSVVRGYRVLQNIKLSTPVSAIIQSIPADVSILRISGSFSGERAFLYGQASFDGGTTYNSVYASLFMTATYVSEQVLVEKPNDYPGVFLSLDSQLPDFPMPVASQIYVGSAGNRVTSIGQIAQFTPAMGVKVVSAFGWTGVNPRATHIRIIASSGQILAPSCIVIEGA